MLIGEVVPTPFDVLPAELLPCISWKNRRLRFASARKHASLQFWRTSQGLYEFAYAVRDAE
jgi:hypothetical protein